MKILHTSDWHIGHRLHEMAQQEEQTLFFNWLIDFINTQEVDVLLVSGDIFDTANPSNQSLAMYYDFLVRLQGTCCHEVIITGGNHDSPSVLNAPKDVLRYINVRVVGKACENIADEVFCLECKNERLIVAAAPYLRDQDIRRAVAGEDSDNMNDRYKTALVNHYNELAAICTQKQQQDEAVIAMGHLFAIGGSTSDSEQTIYVGNLGDIGAEDFPTLFDYVALGHLHRFQSISERVYYSGSPYVLSFSELKQEKRVICLETANSKLVNIEPHIVPSFRKIVRLKGSVEDCLQRLSLLANEHTNELCPWAELLIENCQEPSIFRRISDEVKDWRVELLRISLVENNTPQTSSLDQKELRKLKELSPQEVFELKCQDKGFKLAEHPEIQDVFNEIVQLAQEQ